MNTAFWIYLGAMAFAIALFIAFGIARHRRNAADQAETGHRDLGE